MNITYDDQVELILLSRKGLQYQFFQDVVQAGFFTLKQWSKFLHITERTMQRYKKEQKKFEPIQSERILEIAKLQERGKSLFGSSDYFESWLNSNLVVLGGAKPVDFLDSTFGIDLIMDELGRIEHGVLA